MEDHTIGSDHGYTLYVTGISAEWKFDIQRVHSVHYIASKQMHSQQVSVMQLLMPPMLKVLNSQDIIY